MLRVRDPQASIAFYKEKFGMTLVDTYTFDDMGFSLYFLQSFPPPEDGGPTYSAEPGSDAAHRHLWSTDGTVLELTHNHDSTEEYHASNAEGDGFGHIAFNCDDVEASCERLDSLGVSFKKRPNEGRMPGLAFVYDPDGYWVEIVSRGDGPSKPKGEFNLSQTMLRVKDPKLSVPFYQALGMSVLRETHFDSFSLYFLASLPAGVKPPADPTDRDAAKAFLGGMQKPALELTHNHGTESQTDFSYTNGNETGKRGFGHIGFLVDDVGAACAAITEGCGAASIAKAPEAGSMKGLAFAKDPDGYLVEIVKRGGYDAHTAQPFR